MFSKKYTIKDHKHNCTYSTIKDYLNWHSVAQRIRLALGQRLDDCVASQAWAP